MGETSAENPVELKSGLTVWRCACTSVYHGVYTFFLRGDDMFLILTLLIMLSGFDITSVIRFSRSGAQIIIFFNLSDFWFIFFFFNQIVK